MFLSTSSIQDDLEKVTRKSLIPFLHAGAEIALQEVFGRGNYVAIRPAFFATNAKLWYAKNIREDNVARLFHPDLTFDNITPGDIGNVSGALLGGTVKAAEKDFVRLCGPELLSQREMMRIIGEVLGKKIEVIPTDKEGITKHFLDAGLPAKPVEGLVDSLDERWNGGPDPTYNGEQYEEAMANVKKYGGEEPTKFVDWVKANKEIFL